MVVGRLHVTTLKAGNPNSNKEGKRKVLVHGTAPHSKQQLSMRRLLLISSSLASVSSKRRDRLDSTGVHRSDFSPAASRGKAEGRVMKKGAKIIIDGEIYDGEDDPRLVAKRAAQQQQASAARTHVPVPPRPQHGQMQHPAPAARGFDMNAPPFRTVPSPNALFGLPDVEIFGFRLPAIVLLGLVLVAYRLGWRALLGLGGIYYMYKVSQGNQRAAAAQQPHPQQAGHQPQPQRPAGRQGGGFADLFGALGLDSGANNNNLQAGAAGQAQAAQQQQPQQQQGPADRGAFRGTGHKLGSN